MRWIVGVLLKMGKEVRVEETISERVVNEYGIDYYDWSKDRTKELTGKDPLLRLCACEWQEQLVLTTRYVEDDCYECLQPQRITTSPVLFFKETSRDEDTFSKHCRELTSNATHYYEESGYMLGSGVDYFFMYESDIDPAHLVRGHD